MKQVTMQKWRFINTIVIVSGLSMPWIVFNFDVQIANQQIDPQSGWEFFFLSFSGIIDFLLTNGFEMMMLPIWLVSLSGILLILYLTFNAFAVLKNRRHEKGRAVSIVLVAVVVVFLFPVFIGGTSFLGFWLTNLGVLSSAMLEWQR